MLRPALPQAPAKKRGAGGHGSPVGHLLAMFKIREKRIRVIAPGRHRVFPVTRNRYPSIPEGQWFLCDEKNTGRPLQTI